MSENVTDCRTTIAERLEGVGLSTERFIDVKNGEKGTYDHTKHAPEGVSGNYGIYGGHGLANLDIDDYNDGTDTDALLAVLELPDTFVVESPHTDGSPGGHRLYHVTTERSVDDFDVDEVLSRYIDDEGEKSETYHAAKDDPVALAIAEEFGVVNADPSWGEVRIANQYTVGPGSQIDGCSKDGCGECETPEGGKYTISKDREIAEIGVSELIDVLRSDPVYSDTDGEQKDLESVSYDETDHTRSLPDDADEHEILEYALEESNDDKLRRLWSGDYSDYGGDRSEAESALAYKLAFWLNGDKTAVRRAMDRADTKKWNERTDSSYRNSILEAVDLQTEFYEPGTPRPAVERAPTYDADEVERGEKILKAKTSPESPAGGLIHKNGHYGFEREVRDRETGEVDHIEFDQVANFTLETIEELSLDDGSLLLKVRVHPAHPTEDPYDVEVHPTAFNEARAFKEKIVRGRTTTFDTQGKTQQALNDLKMTVGSQLAPSRRGVEQIGLAGDEYDEWVSPKGIITKDGAADDPAHAYYAKGGDSDSDGGAVARKWNLEPESIGDYDREQVAKILELLPQTRKMERGTPVLGWFYSAPLRPLIHEWTGEFNLLQVVGVTETGKTSYLKTLWEAFGMDPDPFDASDTPFTHMKHMASSNGIPVWIDEYKPADIRSDRLDELLRLLRKTTKGAAVPKGRANLGETLFHLKAPVIISGEQKFSTSHPAVRRRATMANLSKMATDPGSSYSCAFAKLTGQETYETDDGKVVYPDGYDLGQHARAYYQFILETSNDELKGMWESAGEDTKENLSELGIALENTERQGAQTVLFGIRLYRKFAESVGADLSAVPSESDVIDAFDHIASNIGKNGQRRGYADAFLELFAQAAAADGYVERGQDYRIMESQKFGGEVLAFHMPSVYSAVKKYSRDFNLTDEYNVIGKNDYLDEFNDKIERGGSYPEATNHATRLGGGRTKCVVIDHEYAAETLGSDFDLRAFGIDTSDGDDSGTSGGSDDSDPGGGSGGADTDDDTEPIGELSTDGNPYVTVTAEVVTWEATADEVVEAGGPCEAGTVKDDTGAVDAVDFDGCSYAAGALESGMEVRVENARVSTYKGTLQLELVENLTEVTTLETADANQTLAAATDGGGETTEPNETDENAARDDSDSDTPNGPRDVSDTDGGSDTLRGHSLEDPVREYVDENPDADRDEIADHFRDRGAAEKQIEYWINTVLGDETDGETVDVYELPDPDETGALADAQRLRVILEENRGRMPRSDLFGRAAKAYDMAPDDAERALEKGSENGLLTDVGGDTIQSV